MITSSQSCVCIGYMRKLCSRQSRERNLHGTRRLSIIYIVEQLQPEDEAFFWPSFAVCELEDEMQLFSLILLICKIIEK